MNEETIGENQNYLVKMVENPNLDDFSSSWKRLQSNQSLFMTFESANPYVKNYGNLGDVVLFFMERKDNKSLEAIFPLRKKNHFFYKKYLFLFPKLGFNYTFLSSSLKDETKNFFFEKILIKIFSVNSIISLGPVDQQFVEDLSKYVKSTKFEIIHSDFPEHLYVLTLPRTLQELLNSFSRKFRKNLFYYQRKAVKDFTASFNDIKNLKENKKSYEEFLALHKSLIEGKGIITPFEYKPFRDYFFDMISEFGDNNGLFSLKLNDKTACLLLYVDWGDTRYFLNIGVSPNYKQYSVARLSIIHAIEDSINKGMKYFNFGQGDEDYKEDWGCQKFFNKNVTIFSKKYVNFIDSLNNKIYNTIKYFMRIPVLKFPKRILMNLSLRRRQHG